jgi:protein O-mannosyl-transferase
MTSLARRQLESSARTTRWAALAFVAVVGVVYGQGAHAPFVHDDNISVLNNPSIVRLWPLFGTADLRGPLNPPREAVTSGRPLVNLSFAINYHFGRFDTLGYHVVNMILHVLAAMLLYGIVRRTLMLDRFRAQFGTASAPLAFATALVWAIHPLQSDTVEYVSQRTEQMMGICYLATLYASLRYFTGETRRSKVVAASGATLACWMGMACKEVMVTAPVMTLLFDRTFVSGTARRAIKKSWPLYAGLASGWVLLLALNIDVPRSRSAGFDAGLPGYAWWLTQSKVVVSYLKLSVWPWPLVIHHETPILWTLPTALPWLLPIALLGWAILVLLWWRSAIGYLGAWFFVILSPTLVVPVPTEVAAERRMYLPLAALVVLLIVGGFAAITRLRRGRLPSANGLPAPSRWSPIRQVMIGSAVLTIVFSLVTSRRLEAYRDVITIWRDAVACEPNNVRANIGLGCALDDAGRHKEGIEQLERALEINPDHPDIGLAHASLARAWQSLGQPGRAMEHLQIAMELRPDVVNDHGASGSLLLDGHRFSEAVDELRLAVQEQPNNVLLRANLATAYANVGRWSEAIKAAEEARRLAEVQGAKNWVAQIDSWLSTYHDRVTRR